MLGRLGLDLPRRRDVGHQRKVDVADVVAAKIEAHLADGLEERQRLDVAHRAAHLDDRHVGVAGAALDERLDLVGDVRDDLHRAAEVVALPLLLDHRLVDLAGGEVVVAAHLRALEALVVPQVEVGLGAVLRHEHFAVLKRRHRPGIDVDVRVQLDVGDADAARFENRGEGGGGDAFPQRGNYTTGYKNIFRHLPTACRDGGVYTNLRRGKLGAVAEKLQRLRIRQRLHILHRLPVHDVSHCELDDLAALGARDIADLQDFGRDVTRRGVFADLFLYFRDQFIIQTGLLAELDEQDDAHVPFPVLADHQGLDHLLKLLDLAIDLRRADTHAAGIEHGVGAAVDDDAAVLGNFAPVAMAPDVRVLLEIRRPVLRPVRVVPAPDRHGRKRFCTNKLAFLALDREAFFIE